ncbi:MAG: sulfur carrier protein ThiS [Candidatus Hydrogenedens sp.]|nr:sulfur carrier protein ThiS [Candidatus Hydrogenedens sp.]
MNVMINGEARDIPDDATVAAVVDLLGLSEVPVVVQRNDDIVERGRYADVTLAEGDVLELVRFVGGG